MCFYSRVSTDPLFILVYVDDLFVVGHSTACQRLFHSITSHFLVKLTGDLNSEGASVSFLGRHLRRLGESVRIRSSSHYIPGILDLFHLSNANGDVTLGTKALRAVRLDDTAFDPV